MDSAAFNFRSPSRSSAGPGSIPPPGQEIMMASGSFNFQTPATSRSVDILPNAMVSEDDCRRIHGLLVDAREGVALLTSQLAGMNVSSYADKRKLTARRNRLTEFIDAHLAVLSVTRRIPEDVLREIFLACVSFDEPPSLDPNEPPLVLCRVSRDWRCLALSMPRLWNALKIGPLTEGQNDRMQQIADAAKDWLSRSASLPLTIAFIGQPRPVGINKFQLAPAVSRTTTPTYHAVLRTLATFAPRWKSFTFHVAESIHLASLSHVSPSDVSMLQSVSIRCEQIPRSEENLPFLSADTITSVSIHPDYLASRSRNRLPWATVLDLTLDGGSFVAAILRECALLKTFTLRNIDCVYAPRLGDPVLLEELQNFSMTDGERGDSESARSFLRNLVLPNLRHLEYRKNNGWAKESLVIEPVLESCALTLRSLDLIVCMSMTAFFNALQAAKHLEELIIQSEPSTRAGSGEPDHILIPLTPSLASPTPVLCPRLRSVALLNFGSKISDEVLLQFVRERTEGREGLVKLGSVKTRFNR
ncbi:hypothetical protein FB45DRAFT_811705, partial [Roridomyces roridus]